MHTQNLKTVQRMTGEIISHKTPKTAVVKTSLFKVHPKYFKRYLVTKKYVVHDEKDEYKVGDRVEFIPCRPLSRGKAFVVIKKIS